MYAVGEDPHVRSKLDRLAQGRAPRVLDLFAGCGGLALGFARAGGTSVGGVELDPLAAQSYATNFHRTLEGDELANHSIGRDITLPSNEPAALL